ncbi:hypothetical protein COY71_04580, partial [Candidatus Micrarchaeota archaeon CG_4_10_14_0_8_um_filter_60_7]
MDVATQRTGQPGRLRLDSTTTQNSTVNGSLVKARELSRVFWPKVDSDYKGTQVLHFGAGVMGGAFANWTKWKVSTTPSDERIRTVLVDVNKTAVAQLNEQGAYTVYRLENGRSDVDIISNARAIHTGDSGAINSIASDPRTTIISTTVSPNILRIGDGGKVSSAIST